MSNDKVLEQLTAEQIEVERRRREIEARLDINPGSLPSPVLQAHVRLEADYAALVAREARLREELKRYAA